MTVGEKTPVLSGELAFPYEKFTEDLIPEWQEITDRLVQTNKGVADLNDVRLQRGIRISSKVVSELDSLTANAHLTNPAEYTYVQLRNMYYSLPPLIDMSHRTHILDFLAKGLDNEPEDLMRAGEHEMAMVRSRRLASIYEELSVLQADPDGYNAFRALELNQQVSESEHLHIGKSPRKLHARFAVYDIHLRRMTKNYGANYSPVTSAAYLDALEVNAFELAEAIATTRTVPNGDELVTGEVGELVLQLRTKDRLFIASKHMEIEVTQGLIREDHSDPSFGKKLSYDLKLIDHKSNKVQPVEVKKLSDGTGVNGRPNKYLAPIDVARFRLGSNSREFLEITEQYCRDKVRQLRDGAGECFSSEIISVVEEIIDPEITRQFIRLNAKIETSTNYLHRVDEHPTIYEFVREEASDT